MEGKRHLFKHINNIILAEGKKRIFYAFLNIVFMVLSVLSVFGVVSIYNKIFPQNFIGGILLIIICIALCVFLAIYGIVGQLVLIVCSFIGIFRREVRAVNIIAFIVGILSFAGIVLGLLLYL